MAITRVQNRVELHDSYRLNRVMSLFNVGADLGEEFTLETDLPTEPGGDWSIGLVVGPSGSGKSSLGRELSKDGWLLWGDQRWPKDEAIIDCIGRKADFDDVTGALSGVGLGSVPSWLRPYGVLSGGEQFRAGLARLLIERPERVVVDEFTSVVDRQIAKIGAMAFGKAWRRGGGQVVLLSCHHDIEEWLQPDWVLDTGEQSPRIRGCLQQAASDTPGDKGRGVGVLALDI